MMDHFLLYLHLEKLFYYFGIFETFAMKRTIVNFAESEVILARSFLVAVSTTEKYV